ncbi:EF-hand domain-containing protein [Piscinibacter sp. XHJ-5]|uniref:EF-hand domain-containing protein n=1 Tax=Piscinibacter sp. XHJ-5 TaxID=3037797 RepID=UPI002453244B|nr:EF-hand domain-containing protein [Piscinibacter sp. XHJ-5]
MSKPTLLARGSLAVVVLGAALGASAQTQTPQNPSGATSPAGSSTSVSATLDAAFKRADTNGDGKLSPDELKQIPSLASRFGDLDTDKDGAISSTEFSAGVTVKSN